MAFVYGLFLGIFIMKWWYRQGQKQAERREFERMRHLQEQAEPLEAMVNRVLRCGGLS